MSEIPGLVTGMREILLKCGLSPGAIAYNRKRLDKGSEQELETARLWLHGFKAGYLPMYGKAKALVPEGVWAMYERTGTSGSYEQNELRIAVKLIRKEWNNRPVILKRTNGPKSIGKKNQSTRKQST